MTAYTTAQEYFNNDFTNAYLGTSSDPGEFSAEITIRDNTGSNVTTRCVFVFQAGAVDEKERAVFYIDDSVTIERGYRILIAGEQWITVDIRPDKLGMNEVRCDRPEVTT